jgi:phosphate transport system substrate-binding protein
MDLARCAAVCAALFLFPLPVAAQDVTLTARDGTLQISGTMQSHDGEFYRVQTDFGLLTLDAQGVVCTGPGCPDLEAYVAEARIFGAPQIGETLFAALISGYAEAAGLRQTHMAEGATRFTQVLADPGSGRDRARLHYRLFGSDHGLARLADGRADLALSYREAPDTARGRVLALDAFVPLVGQENPLASISLPDLAAVLAGKITDWGALGGTAGAPIMLHALGARSGLQRQLETLLPGRVTAGAVRHATPAELADAVARDPDALGVGVYSDTGGARVLAISGACGITLSATPESLKAEDYPLPAPTYLYLPHHRLPLVLRAVLDFVATPRGQAEIRRAGLVDLTPAATGIAGQGARLADAITAAGPEVDLAELQRLVAAMRGARRLSTTFRFRDGSADLDTQSRGNLADLARGLESGAHAGLGITFIGFSDGNGPAGPNRDLALRRAGAVRDALQAMLRLPRDAWPDITVDSFGEALPIACDDTDRGRHINRRVEVWLR